LFRSWVGGPGLRVLDLGCRDGALTSAYLEGNQVVGVDIDRAALARAEQLGIETAWADLDQPLPFADECFDVVVLAEVLEHLRFPEQVLQEARRVLRPGGVLVGSVPNNYRLKSRLRFLIGRPPENDPTLIRLFGVGDVDRLLADWEEVSIRCVAGRLIWLRRSWFANDIVFRAERVPAPELDPRKADSSAGKRARTRVAATAAAAALFLFLLFVVAPEALGDRPYGVF
jgi:SAM-dependent methyltransferase